MNNLDKILKDHELWIASLGYKGSRADLSDADLRWADLRGADLIGADLSGAELPDALRMQCPETGSFIGYKKSSGKIVKLLITADAKRSSATSRKCRCDKAVVLAIENLDGTNANTNAVASNYDIGFIYEVGKTVAVNNFDDNRWNECSTGIHFFITKREAVEY